MKIEARSAEQPALNGDSEPHRLRRSQLGFNVTDVGLLREERQ